MMRPAMVLVGLVLLVTPAAAQLQTGGNSAFVYEQYSFDSGLAYLRDVCGSRPAALPLPGPGRRCRRTGPLAGAGDPDVGLDDKEIAGIIDTEARLVVDLIPDRLSLLATGVLPTGIEALEVQEEAILAALSSPVIGFSTTRLGGGGRVGGGLVGALPVGQMALGLAGTYTHSVGYSPVLGHDMEWQPGAEIRLRAGLEGTVGPQSYLGCPTIFASRQADKLDGEEQGEVDSDPFLCSPEPGARVVVSYPLHPRFLPFGTSNRGNLRGCRPGSEGEPHRPGWQVGLPPVQRPHPLFQRPSSGAWLKRPGTRPEVGAWNRPGRP